MQARGDQRTEQSDAQDTTGLPRGIEHAPPRRPSAPCHTAERVEVRGGTRSPRPPPMQQAASPSPHSRHSGQCRRGRRSHRRRSGRRGDRLRARTLGMPWRRDIDRQDRPHMGTNPSPMAEADNSLSCCRHTWADLALCRQPRSRAATEAWRLEDDRDGYALRPCQCGRAKTYD
jgi:hypothetical protein